jgi:hypothetical protein
LPFFIIASLCGFLRLILSEGRFTVASLRAGSRLAKTRLGR